MSGVDAAEKCALERVNGVLCDYNQKPTSIYIYFFFGFQDNLMSLSINGLLRPNLEKEIFPVKLVFWSKITILHIFECLDDQTTKKEKKIRHIRRHKLQLNINITF